MSKILKLAASTLTAFAGITAEKPKSAGVYDLKEDHPNADPKLQALVGDPNKGGLSMFVQRNVDVGDTQLASPLTPFEGDDIFFNGLLPGSRFQDHSGQWWDILEYFGEGLVRITSPWYPRLGGWVSVQNVRKSIYSWIEPFTCVVPPPPVDVDYGILDVRVVK